MKTYGPNNPRLSGSLNKDTYVAYYPEFGHSVIKRKPKSKGTESWTQKQKDSFNRFQCIRSFTMNCIDTIVRPIWNKHKELGSNGFNNFIKCNKKAFNNIGEIAYPAQLYISSGVLPLPPDMNVLVNMENKTIIVSWTKDLTIHEERDMDMLFYGYLNEQPSIDLFATGIARDKKEYILRFTEDEKIPKCIYFFFASTKQDMFSDSQAFTLN